MIWIIVLAVFGLVLIIAEVFFPSMGILSVFAGICLVSAVVLGFQEGETTGLVVLVCAAVAVPAVVYHALKLLPRTPFGRVLVLDAEAMTGSNRGGQEAGLEQWVGRTGVAVSPLRPAGFARIDGKRLDVVTRGEPLDLNTAVVVIEVEGNRIVVAADPSVQVAPE